MKKTLISLMILFGNYSLASTKDIFDICSETTNMIVPTYEKIFDEWVIYKKIVNENPKNSTEQYQRIKKINLAIQDALTTLIDEKKLDPKTTSYFYNQIKILNIEINLMASSDSETKEKKSTQQVKRELIRMCHKTYILGIVD